MGSRHPHCPPVHTTSAGVWTILPGGVMLGDWNATPPVLVAFAERGSATGKRTDDSMQHMDLALAFGSVACVLVGLACGPSLVVDEQLST